MPSVATQNERERFPVIAVILSVSAALSYLYVVQTILPNLDLRMNMQARIVDGTAPSPYRYRILVPWASELIQKSISPILSMNHSHVLCYAIYDMLALTLFMSSFYLYLKYWFSVEQSLIGILIVAALLPIALRDHFYQPWSILEAGLYSISLLAMIKRRYTSLAVLILLASLNRETAIFIPLMFLSISIRADRSISRGEIVWTLVFFFIWLFTFLGLRVVLGPAPSVTSLQNILAHNLSGSKPLKSLIHVTLFMGVLWMGVLYGFRTAPTFMKRVVLVLPLYLLCFLVWGVWYEVRLLIPLYPILLPPVLSCFFAVHEPND